MRIGILFFIIIVVLVGTAVFSSSASAELVTISLEGVVDYAYDPYGFVGADIEVGDLITGTYTFNTETMDSNPSAWVGDYEHDSFGYGFSLSIGGVDFQTNSANVNFLIESINNNAGRDGLLFWSESNLPMASGVPLETLSWTLVDSSQTALRSSALPGGPPVLDDWLINELKIIGPSRGASFSIVGHVTSAVPEPATMLLLSLGMVSLTRRRKRE